MRTLIYNLTKRVTIQIVQLLWLHHTAQGARQIYQPGLWRAPRQHSWASPCW